METSQHDIDFKVYSTYRNVLIDAMKCAMQNAQEMQLLGLGKAA